jgi:hypothetical protein
VFHLFGRDGENRVSARSTKRIAREAKPATVIVKRRPAILRSCLPRLPGRG